MKKKTIYSVPAVKGLTLIARGPTLDFAHMRVNCVNKTSVSMQVDCSGDADMTVNDTTLPPVVIQINPRKPEEVTLDELNMHLEVSRKITVMTGDCEWQLTLVMLNCFHCIFHSFEAGIANAISSFK